MAKRMVLDVDAEMGMAQYVEADEDGVTLITKGLGEERVLDENKRKQGVHQGIARGTQTWGHHVASIPRAVYEQFCRENPELRQNTRDAQAWLIRRLNDREYCHLRTYDGKV